MELNTASAVIGFAKKLEEDSAKFYEGLSLRDTPNMKMFSSPLLKKTIRM